MPRRARIVIPNLPHHVTQRGARRHDVFFTAQDRRVYLKLLAKYAEKYGAELLSYCLMTNHVHHLLVPRSKDSIRWTFQITHKRYAEYINSLRDCSGHLWQERFYSSPLDTGYLWVTLRYIARNPVEAGVVDHAADYNWSSAAAHCGLREDSLLTKDPSWRKMLCLKSNWYEWLDEREDSDSVNNLRTCSSKDLPCGSEQFLDNLERKYGVKARAGKVGRPKKGKDVTVTN